jgi:hypothetical protein
LIGTDYYAACSDPNCEGGIGGACDGAVVPTLSDECGFMAANVANGSCADPCGSAPPPVFECTSGLTVTLIDSWGDGWNGNQLTVGSEIYNLLSGSEAQYCYEGPTDVDVTCDGGSYQSEVSWTIADASGALVAEGGAPYGPCSLLDGCAPPPVFECTSGLTVTLTDSFGDGWNGASLTVGTEVYDLLSGSEAQYCYEGSTDVDVTCTAGSFPSEVSWTIADASGALVAEGTAPYGPCSLLDGCPPAMMANNGSYTQAEINSARVAKIRYLTNLEQQRENRKSVYNMINPPMVVNIDGEVLLYPNQTNRAISYEILVTCDDCNNGEAVTLPVDGLTTTGYILTGIDEGALVCGAVRAVSGNTGTVSEYTATECANSGCGPNCVAGDANGDGSVNVSDIVLLVGAILNNSGSTEGVECGDMPSPVDGNADGTINVSDIVSIINIILNPMTSTSDATEAKINIGEDVTIEANGQISAIQMVLSHNADFSLDLTEDAWVSEYVSTENKTTLIVVMPNSEYLFTPKGEFTIEDMIVLNSENQIDVTSNIIPSEFSVSNAYPNPFNPVTALNINLPQESVVKVNVYNVAGQMVGSVFNNSLVAGTHSISWDASNLSSGVYLIRTEAGKNISTQKVMLLK